MADREYEYDRYEVKLSRLMNIGKDWGFCLKILATFALVAVYGIFVHGAEAESIAFLAGVFFANIIPWRFSGFPQTATGLSRNSG